MLSSTPFILNIKNALIPSHSGLSIWIVATKLYNIVLDFAKICIITEWLVDLLPESVTFKLLYFCNSVDRIKNGKYAHCRKQRNILNT